MMILLQLMLLCTGIFIQDCNFKKINTIYTFPIFSFENVDYNSGPKFQMNKMGNMDGFTFDKVSTIQILLLIYNPRFLVDVNSWQKF